ncbi:ParB/RepB/Spo0J family partition protein [Azospirillum canadense]|uniref:ParB/RepB/Spo0J family partition protein n=1 Tax=Azospirillum canadense TaxID=403962 RepID=UPI002227A3A1|nr:ParB/RepB/Spo0J family partition protein [Azospirillum canadense]MCW2242562.1 ParB family chromosome partitioning protein [Azospirillum canadense]
MAPKFQRATRAQITAGAAAREGEDAAETNKLFGLSGTLPRLIEADVERIVPNPDQPRTVFDDDALRSLADSIDKHGLQQPILVKTTGTPGHYTLVAGERRWRAHILLGRPTIAAIITQGRSEEIALIENLQRVDLDAIDLARGLERLMEQHGYRMSDVGAMLGCAEAEVSRRLSVLRLPDAIVAEYRADPSAVSRSVLVELATLDDPDLVRALWDRAKAGLTVRDLRAEKKQAQAAGKTATAARTRPVTVRALGQSVTKIVGEIDRLDQGRALLGEDHRSHLRAVRDRINALLGE